MLTRSFGLLSLGWAWARSESSSYLKDWLNRWLPLIEETLSHAVMNSPLVLCCSARLSNGGRLGLPGRSTPHASRSTLDPNRPPLIDNLAPTAVEDHDADLVDAGADAARI